MSVPRNNLAELLKLKAKNILSSPQTYTPPPRTRSGVSHLYIAVNITLKLLLQPKFKPAISSSTSDARK